MEEYEEVKIKIPIEEKKAIEDSIFTANELLIMGLLNKEIESLEKKIDYHHNEIRSSYKQISENFDNIYEIQTIARQTDKSERV